MSNEIEVRKQERMARLMLQWIEHDFRVWRVGKIDFATTPRFWKTARRNAQVLAGIAMENVWC